MKKNIYKILLLLVLTLSPYLVKADCTTEEIKHFREIEDDYKVTYEFDKETKTYTLTFYNPEPDMYDFVITNGGFENNCETINDNSAVCTNVTSKNYTIEVVGFTDSCEDTLKTITLKLPKYNEYSEDPLCNGIEEFVLCQPTYDKEIDRDTFESRVATYKKNLESKETKEEVKVKEESKIIRYIKDNLIQIIVVSVFVIMLIITIILTANSIKKSRRLE